MNSKNIFEKCYTQMATCNNNQLEKVPTLEEVNGTKPAKIEERYVIGAYTDDVKSVVVSTDEIKTVDKAGTILEKSRG